MLKGKFHLPLIAILLLPALGAAGPITENADSTSFRIGDSITPSSSSSGAGGFGELEGRVITHSGIAPANGGCPRYQFTASTRVINGDPQLNVSSSYGQFGAASTGWISNSAYNGTRPTISEMHFFGKDAGGWYLQSSGSGGSGKCTPGGASAKTYF